MYLSLCLAYLFILHLTCSLFAMPTKTAFPHKQPFGIKMCALLCRHIGGCTVYTFESPQLKCQLMDNSTDVDKRVRRVFVNTMDNGAPQCRWKSRLVRIKAEIRCIEPVSIELTAEETPGMTSFQRILVASYGGDRETALYQVFTQTNTIRKYQFFSSKSISTLAYISASRKILVGLMKTREILTVPLDATGQSTLAYNIRARSIAPDEDKQYLFIASTYRRCTIVRMTIDGSRRRSIKETGRSGQLCGDIALDRRYDRVYACHGRRIVSIAYDGSDYKVVIRLDKISGALALDMVGNEIYYNNKFTILRQSLLNEGRRTVTTVHVPPLNIVYHNDTIYVSSVMHNRYISVFKLSHEGSEKEIDVAYNSFPGMLMCAIP